MTKAQEDSARQTIEEERQIELVRWFSNNQNVVRIVLPGSKTPLLQKLALFLLHLCVVNHVTIEPEWIPRKKIYLVN